MTVGLVPVSVTNTVIGYLRRRLDGEVIDFVELDMPTRTLDTAAVMCTITPEALQHNGIDSLRVPGALHAAEHAAIGLLPLVASCDRGDIGGVSTAVGPVHGLPTMFVYDGYPGGAGFADRGFRKLDTLVGGDGGGDRGLRMPAGLPVVRAVAEVRQRQRSAGQGRARCGCCAWCSARLGGARRESAAEGDRPLDGRPRGSAVQTVLIKHAEHADRCGERSDNAIRSQSRKSGAGENYLVGGGVATHGCR